MKVLVPFGPLIYQGDISEDSLKYFLSGAEKSRDHGDDMRSSLAGHIKTERSGLFDPQIFMDHIDIHVRRYLYLVHERRCNLNELHVHSTKEEQHKLDLRIVESVMDPNIKINYDMGGGPWINFQTKGEFNPLHEHSGDISAIMFLDIPKEIAEENKDDQHQCMRIGCLEFAYDNSCCSVITPKTGMIFLFPANLRHTVYPFKSDVERITMSFNLSNVKFL